MPILPDIVRIEILPVVRLPSPPPVPRLQHPGDLTHEADPILGPRDLWSVLAVESGHGALVLQRRPAGVRDATEGD